MRVFLWTLAILSVVALAVWLNAERLAARGLDYILTKQELPIQSYRVVRLSRSHVVLRDLVLGEQSRVKAEQLDLRITWEGKKATRYDWVLKGADIHAELVGGRLRLDGLERLWDNAPAPTGDATAMHLTGEVRGRYQMGGEVTLTLAGAMFSASREEVALLAPLAIEATARGNVRTSIGYEGTFSALAKKLQGSARGMYDILAKSHRMAWRITPVRFAPDGLTFAQLSPAYADAFPTYPMRLSAKGDLIHDQDSWTLTPLITFHELPLSTLLAGVLGADATVDGIIAGAVPLTITPERWRIAPSRLGNKGKLHIAVSPVGRAASLVAAHPQAEIVLGALANFEVDDMTLDARSTDDRGGVHFGWHFLGANPELFGGKKVDFTLAVNANLEDIWISATQAESLAEKATATSGATP